MLRFLPLALSVATAAVVFGLPLRVHAVAKSWNTTSSFWDVGPWNPAGQPTSSDSATFDVLATYFVRFDSITGDPTINNLDVIAGNVTFHSINGLRTLHLTGTGGSNSVDVNNATFTLGVNGGPMALNVGGDLSVTEHSEMNVVFDSDVNIAGNIALMAAAGGGGELAINGVGSSVTQSGAGMLQVGLGLIGSAGSVDIGTATSGGVLTTGTGPMLISRTGTVNIGSGLNEGTLNANGDVTIDGVLTCDPSADFNLAVGKTMTVQNGGFAGFAGAYTTAANAIYNITGMSSLTGLRSTVRMSGFLGAGGLTIGNGAQVNVSSGGQLDAADPFNAAFSIGTSGDGTLVVDGTGSSVTTTAATSIFGSGANADVTIRNGATGVFTFGVHLAHSATAGTAARLDVLSDADLTVGHLELATLGGTTTMASLNINGTGSTVTQTDIASIAVGHFSEGLASVNIGTTANGGTLTTGTGTFIINKTGAVTIGAGANAGTLSANGDVVIDGGVLQRAAGSQFALALGKTMTIENGGQASFDGEIYATAANAVYNISGADSKLEMVGSTSILGIRDDAEVNVTSGGSLSAESQLLIGFHSTSGTLTINGIGSSATIGAGGSMEIGEPNGDGIVNVQDGGALTMGAGGTTTLRARGTLNIDGGAVDLKTLNDLGGTINFTAGSLSYLGDLTVGTGGLLGTNLTLESNRQLTLSGTTTIDAGRRLTLNGGTLNTGSLVVNGALAFNAGTLGITGAGGLAIGSGGPLGGAFTLGAGRTVNVTNTTTVNTGSLLVLENGGGFSSGIVNNNGEIVLDGPAAVLQSATVNNGGLLSGRGRIDAPLHNLAAGEVRAATGELLKFLAANTSVNNGRINLLGGTVEFTQSTLTNALDGQIVGHGSLIADSIHNDGTMAFSGQANVLGDVTNYDGLIISSGGGPTTFFDDVVNDGEIRTSPGSYSVFFGSVSGAGTFTGAGTVNIEGDLSPGSSPATASFGGDVVFGSESSLAIELGGTTAGTFDQVQVEGQLSLDGLLAVSLFGDFEPAAGNSFDILDWASLAGTFDTLELPALSGDLTWNASRLYTSGVLSVTLVGDYNLDGAVDAADYIVWRKTLGQTGAALAADGNSNGEIDDGDYSVWVAHFGHTAGSGTVGDQNGAVPEPASSALLVATAVMAVASVRRPRASGCCNV